MSRGPHSAAGKSYRSGQRTAGAVAGTATLFATCAFTTGGWQMIQWVALAIVLTATAMIVVLQRFIRSAEARYVPPARPAIVARPAGTPPVAPAPARRLTPGPNHRTGPPVDAARKGR